MGSVYRYNYLSLFNEPRLRLKESIQPREPIKGFETLVPEYDFRIRGAARDVVHYFNDKDAARPLCILVLGPPGSGKTYLAQKLMSAAELKEEDLITINCSRFGSSQELADKFCAVADLADKNKFVLIDEFDVSLVGSSAIRYLIDSIYEGVDSRGRKFKKTVFVFCGSYLRDLKTLRDLEGRGAAIDLPGFLNSMFMRCRHDGHRDLLRDAFLSATGVSIAGAGASPEQNIVKYLRRLEKLTDFLSRINGPVLEIPDVARPLEVARPFFLISGHHWHDGQEYMKASLASVELTDYCTPRQLISFVERAELPRLVAGELIDVPTQQDLFSFVVSHVWSPVLAFKNMVLNERLLRVCSLILRKKLPKKSSFQISAADLNFLVTVPVVHGMRSLETIIAKLLSVKKDTEVELKMTKYDPVVESQIVDEGAYDDPKRLWNQIMHENGADFRGNELMTVIP
jgi:hypothetical protein